MAELIIAKFGSNGGGSGDSKIDISSATVTLASGTLTYDGTPKMQAVSSVIVGGQTLTAGTDYNVINNSYTNAGNYTLTVSGMGNYEGNKNVAWSIEKAAGSVIVSPASVTIIGANGTSDVAVSVTGDGTISVSSSDNSVATASISGNTITVTSVASGSATITVTLATGTNYTGDSVAISVRVMVISSTLADCTPEEIQAAARAGIADSLWNVGDATAPIHISATDDLPNFTPPTEDVCAFIIGFDHNSDIEGTNRIHFQFGRTTTWKYVAFVDSGYGNSQSSGTWFNMSNGNTNSGGWRGSNIRRIICPAFLSALPSDWQGVISDCTKYTNNSGSGTNATSTDDKMFLLAEYEVTGSRQYAATGEQNRQQQYAYYKYGGPRIRYRHSLTNAAACIWWLRSPYIGGTSNEYCRVITDGSNSKANAKYSYGFAPAFSIV